MSVTIIKESEKTAVKAKPKAKAKGKVNALAKEIAREIIRIDALIKPMKADLEIQAKALAARKEELLEQFPELKPDENKKVICDEGIVTVGVQANVTEIVDNLAVVEKLEEAEEGLAAKIAKFGLTDLKKYLSGTEVEEVTNTERKGARRFTIKATEKE